MGRLTDRLPTDVLERARERYRAARYDRAQRVVTAYLADRLRRDAAARAMMDYLAADVLAATATASSVASASGFHDYALPRDVEAEVRRGQAEALRAFGPWVQQEHACDPEEECPEGTCRLCDLLFAVYSDANDRADAIEAGETPMSPDLSTGLGDPELDACIARHPAGGSSLLAGGAPSVPTRGAAELVEDEDGAPRAAGVQDIAAERAQQVLKGYTRDHDAAEHSVMDFVVQAGHVLGLTFVTKPWCLRSSPILEPNRLDLVRSGALIAAAIDRWDSRAEQDGDDL